MGDIMQTLTTS